MILKAFDNLFPEQAHLDRCHVMLAVETPDDNTTLEVLDLYCPDSTCDCHKVTLLIVDNYKNIWATISYGWKSKSFYLKWGLDLETVELLTEGFLDPIGVQSEYAEELMDAFEFMIKDSAFMDRLKKRYAQFKARIAENDHNNVYN